MILMSVHFIQQVPESTVKGFIILIVIVLVALIGFLGYWLWKRNKKTKEPYFNMEGASRVISMHNDDD